MSHSQQGFVLSFPIDSSFAGGSHDKAADSRLLDLGGDAGWRGRGLESADAGARNQTVDQRTRGVGGRNCSCGEENLLKLPNDRYRGRDIMSHEFTHTIHHYGVSPNVADLINATWEHAVKDGLWINPANGAPGPSMLISPSRGR